MSKWMSFELYPRYTIRKKYINMTKIAMSRNIKRSGHAPNKICKYPYQQKRYPYQQKMVIKSTGVISYATPNY